MPTTILQPRAARLLLLCAALALPALSAWAQADKVFKGSELNSSALIEALEPPPAPVLTRSLRVTKQAGTPAEKPRQPAASMLITFMTNSDELTPEAKQGLDTLGAALKSDRLATFKFAIEGHADPRGGDDFNLKLSQRRAESVVAYLADKQGIERSRLQPVGKGQSELLNHSNPFAPENRRVTVKTLTE